MPTGPVDGKVKFVKHENGKYMKAWLPKAEENEHADIMITTPEGVDVLCRQIAGAVARHRYLRQGGRGVLHRRASGLHQAGFSCRRVSAYQHGSMRQDGTGYHR